MKTTFFCALLMIAICNTSLSQTLVLNKKLLNERYKKYIDKPVYSFLLDDNIRQYHSLFVSDEPPGILAYVSLNLTDSIYVRIYIDELKYQKRFNKKMDWDEQLIYKEKVGKIMFLIDNLDNKVIANITR